MRDNARCAPGALVVRFNRLLEHRAFIIRVKLDLFQPGMAFLVNADIILCAKFRRVLCFSPDNRPKVWLADTDNPAFNAVCMIVKHVLLLTVQFHDRQIEVGILCRQGIPFRHICLKVSKITAEALQLLADQGTQLFRRTFLALCNSQVFPACYFPSRCFPRLLTHKPYPLCVRA